MRPFSLSLSLSLALLLAAVAGPATAADTTLRPGLWEFRTTGVHIGGMRDINVQIRQQLQVLSPELQQSLRKQLASQGIQLGDDGSVKRCISAEEARSDAIYAGRGDGRCRVGSVSRSGNVVRGRVECTAPVAGSGDFEATLDGTEHMTTSVRIQTAQGEARLDSEARWLSACPTARAQE